MNKLTERFNLSKYELLSSTRDAVVVGGLSTILEIVKILQGQDYGVYSVLAVAGLTFIATTVNRYLNIWRRK